MYNTEIKFTAECLTATCTNSVDLRDTLAMRCEDCQHLVRIGCRVDRLSPRGLRYMQATLHADVDMDRVM